MQPNINNSASHKNVNSDELKKQWKSSAFNLLHALLPNAPYWEKVGDNWQPVHRLFDLPQHHCAMGNFTMETFSPRIKKSREGQLLNAYREWAWFRNIVSQRPATDEELKLGLLQIENKIQVFSVDINGKERHFESNTKGTARYNKKKSFQAMDFIKNHCDGNYNAYFLTTTCDPSKYTSIADAWEKYDTEELKKILENLRKHYGCEYIRAIESFGNQYPHSHILLFFPKGVFDEWEKMKNKQEIKYGKLHELCKGKGRSHIFHLECAKGDNLKYYLTKYILKGTSSEILSLSKKEGEFTKTERKTACELVFMKAFRKHTIEKTSDKSIKVLAAKAEKKSARVFEAKKQEIVCKSVSDFTAKSELSAREARRLLTSLCTNSPLTCCSAIKCMPLKRYRAVFKANPNQEEVITPEKRRMFSSYCNVNGCAGCFWTEFIRFINDWNSSALNIRMYFDKKHGIYSDFTDGYDFNDDESFIECVKNLVDYYFKRMYLQGYDVQVISEQKEEVWEKMCDIECTKHDKHELRFWKVIEKGVEMGYRAAPLYLALTKGEYEGSKKKEFKAMCARIAEKYNIKKVDNAPLSE